MNTSDRAGMAEFMESFCYREPMLKVTTPEYLGTLSVLDVAPTR
jgi:hypothetical protein